MLILLCWSDQNSYTDEGGIYSEGSSRRDLILSTREKKPTMTSATLADIGDRACSVRSDAFLQYIRNSGKNTFQLSLLRQVCDLTASVRDRGRWTETTAGKAHPQRLSVDGEKVPHLLNSSLVAHLGEGEAPATQDHPLIAMLPLRWAVTIHAEAEAPLKLHRPRGNPRPDTPPGPPGTGTFGVKRAWTSPDSWALRAASTSTWAFLDSFMALSSRSISP